MAWGIFNKMLLVGKGLNFIRKNLTFGNILDFWTSIKDIIKNRSIPPGKIEYIKNMLKSSHEYIPYIASFLKNQGLAGYGIGTTIDLLYNYLGPEYLADAEKLKEELNDQKSTPPEDNSAILEKDDIAGPIVEDKNYSTALAVLKPPPQKQKKTSKKSNGWKPKKGKNNKKLVPLD